VVQPAQRAAGLAQARGGAIAQFGQQATAFNRVDASDHATNILQRGAEVLERADRGEVAQLFGRI
jgi:hypothetical protein